MATRYFPRNTNADTGCDTTALPRDLSTTQGSSTSATSDAHQNEGAYVEVLTCDVDVSGSEPVGDSYDVSVDLTGITDINARWRLQEINSGCGVQTSSGYSTVYSTTGIKTDTLVMGAAWTTGTRLRLSFETIKVSNHGNKALSINVNDADSWVDAPAAAAATDDAGLIAALNLRRSLSAVRRM